MKLSVSVYSFHQYAKRGERAIYSVIDFAKRLGFEGMDFVDAGLAHDEYLVYAQKVGEYCREKGIEPACFCVHADFLKGTDSDLAEEIERVKKQVDKAAAYGVSVMRHDVAGFMSNFKGVGSYENAIDRLAIGCREVTKYAEQKGIRTCTENHGFFSQDAVRVERLIETVKEPNFGMLVDIGNFMCADEDPAVSVGRCAQYAFHVHAKDFYWRNGALDAPGEGWFKTRAGNYLKGAIVGHGIVPVRQCLDTLKRNAYDGFVGLEFEGMEDPLTGIRVGKANLDRFLGTL